MSLTTGCRAGIQLSYGAMCKLLFREQIPPKIGRDPRLLSSLYFGGQAQNGNGSRKTFAGCFGSYGAMCRLVVAKIINIGNPADFCNKKISANTGSDSRPDQDAQVAERLNPIGSAQGGTQYRRTAFGMLRSADIPKGGNSKPKTSSFVARTRIARLE
jgi:hypothetical protein